MIARVHTEQRPLAFVLVTMINRMTSASSACRTAIFCLAALAPAAVLAQGGTSADKDLAARVDAVFAQWDKPDSPGCAVGVYRDGAIAYARGYGMADLERVHQRAHSARNAYGTPPYKREPAMS